METTNPTLPELVTHEGKKLVVNDIRLQTVDLTPKDIEDWVNAQKSAKSVYYPNRTRLYNIYESILNDGHLTGIIQKRMDAVLNKELIYVDKNGEKIDAFDDLIDNERFGELLNVFMETPFWGLSGFEFIPGADFDFKDIPRKHIKPKWGIITSEENGQEGHLYHDNPNILVIGKATDCGLLLKCAPYVIYKRGNLADWSQYIEIFGQPIRIIKYDANDKQTKIELKEVLDESGSSLALMIPKQADFEMMDGKQSNGDGKLQDTHKDAMNTELSVLVLGNTETTTNGKTGSQAKSITHQKEQLQVTKHDLRYMRYKLNNKKFLAILKSYGFPVVEGGKFMFSKEADLDLILKQIEVAEKAQKMGLPIGHEYLYEITGIPKPDNYDELVEEQRAQREQLLKKEKDRNNRKPEPEADDLFDRQTETLWHKIRLKLADFFDQPR